MSWEDKRRSCLGCGHATKYHDPVHGCSIMLNDDEQCLCGRTWDGSSVEAIACKTHRTNWNFGCYECAWKEHVAKDARRLLGNTSDPEVIAVIEKAVEGAVRKFDGDEATTMYETKERHD